MTLASSFAVVAVGALLLACGGPGAPAKSGRTASCDEALPTGCIEPCHHDEYAACVTWARGAPDEREVTPLLERGCDAGNGPACAALGTRLRTGRGAARDRGKAITVFEKACSLHETLACIALATPAYEGSLTEADFQRLMRAYDALCLAGWATGCSLRGLGYMQGSKQSPKDPAQARRLFEQGCKEGDRLGCLFRDALARGGEDPKEPNRLAMLEALCDLANGFACTILGGAYDEGDGVPRDRTRAAHLLERGCEAASSLACMLVAAMYMDGVGVPKDEARAIHDYELACDGGQGNGCAILGLAHMQGAYGVAEDHAIGAALLERGCDFGAAESCAAWGALLHTGDGVPKDDARARTVLDYGCEHGSPDACAKRGALAYELGDKEAGVGYLKRACTLGLKTACQAVEAIRASGP